MSRDIRLPAIQIVDKYFPIGVRIGHKGDRFAVRRPGRAAALDAEGVGAAGGKFKHPQVTFNIPPAVQRVDPVDDLPIDRPIRFALICGGVCGQLSGGAAGEVDGPDIVGAVVIGMENNILPIC